MRMVVGLISVLAGACAGGYWGMLAGLGLFAVPGIGQVAGAGTTATLLSSAGVGALLGGLLGTAVCLLLLGLASRMVRLR